MKPTLELAQAIRRSIMDQAEVDGCLNSDTLDERILGALALAETRRPREVKKTEITRAGPLNLTDAELLRYLAYLSS